MSKRRKCNCNPVSIHIVQSLIDTLNWTLRWHIHCVTSECPNLSDIAMKRAQFLENLIDLYLDLSFKTS